MGIARTNLLLGRAMLRVREGGIFERDNRTQVRYAQRTNVGRKRKGQDFLDAAPVVLLFAFSALGTLYALQLGHIIVEVVIVLVHNSAVIFVVDDGGGRVVCLVWRHGRWAFDKKWK